MARRPKKVRTPEEIVEERKKLKERYFMFVQIGCLMIIMTSISPFFAANQIPAIVVLTISIIYDRWESASKGKKRIMAYTSLLFLFFLGFNALNGWFLPPEHTETASKLVPSFITREQTITFGYIGHMIALIGVLQTFAEIRLTPAVGSEQSKAA